MTLNDLLMRFKTDMTISVTDYNQENDAIGERRFFFGTAGELFADEAKLRRIGGREVKAIDQGLVSLMIAI